MKNSFFNKKKKLPSTITSVIANNNNSISGPIAGLPSGLMPINIIGSSGISVQGICGGPGTLGIQGPTRFASSASTWSWITPEESMEQRKKELMDEFQKNPELFSEIIVELRKRKIKQLREKSTPQ